MSTDHWRCSTNVYSSRLYCGVLMIVANSLLFHA